MRNEMVRRRKLLPCVVLLLLAAGLVAGCGDDDDGGITGDNGNGNGNGDVTTTLSFKLDDVDHSTEICIGNFFPDEDMTSITAGDGTSWTLVLEFPDDGPGSFDETGMTGSLVIAPSLTALEFQDVSLTVSAYGGVGDEITGTFSGTLVNIADDDDVRAVTEGVFTAERHIDVR